MGSVCRKLILLDADDLADVSEIVHKNQILFHDDAKNNLKLSVDPSRVKR